MLICHNTGNLFVDCAPLMLMQIVDPASGPARVLEVIAQASLDAYVIRIQVQKPECCTTKLLSWTTAWRGASFHACVFSGLRNDALHTMSSHM